MALMERLRNGRSVAVPAVVGIVALVLALLVIAWSTRGNDSDTSPTKNNAQATSKVSPQEPTSKPTPPKVASKPFTYRKGGYRLDAPTNLVAKSKGTTTRFTAKDKSLVITVGQSGPGRLAPAQKRFLATLSKSYKKVTVLRTEDQKVDGRPARATYGSATNSKGVNIRFVTFMVRNKPRNFALTAYTASGSDPATVLPRVNRVVNSFEVLPARKK